MKAAGISGHPRGDDPPAEAAVDFEIRVGGEEEGIGWEFSETERDLLTGSSSSAWHRRLKGRLKPALRASPASILHLL